MRHMQLAQAFHGNGDKHHRRAKQHKTQPVETGTFAAAQIRNEVPDRPAAENAHGQVDQEDPVPAQVLHHPAAHRGADQRAEQAGDGDKAHDPHQFRARIGLEHHQPADGQHQGTTQALDDPCADQLVESAGQGAEQRAETEQQDGAEKDFFGAEAVGDPPRGRDQQGDGEHVGNDHTLHAQRVFVEVAGHVGQGGVEDGAVE